MGRVGWVRGAVAPGEEQGQGQEGQVGWVQGAVPPGEGVGQGLLAAQAEVHLILAFHRMTEESMRSSQALQVTLVSSRLARSRCWVAHLAELVHVATTKYTVPCVSCI